MIVSTEINHTLSNNHSAGSQSSNMQSDIGSIISGLQTGEDNMNNDDEEESKKQSKRRRNVRI